ncbi:hypothetical protein DFH05DRAFT_1488943 [Lentinula detonsa]|uniref:Secreted protein n=1 Tax=Lentinula detonsa TaxID=2804962 RepID=A0A9W8P2G7_9AGAR|nr:hypothetical protein DFH05DRAFT_1488943 [Lentinula detonsa]
MVSCRLMYSIAIGPLSLQALLVADPVICRNATNFLVSDRSSRIQCTGLLAPSSHRDCAEIRESRSKIASFRCNPGSKSVLASFFRARMSRNSCPFTDIRSASPSSLC